jgi:hypothetical protein
MVDSLLRAGFWIPLALCTLLALLPAPPQAPFAMSDVFQHGIAFVYLTFVLLLVYPLLSARAVVVLMLAYGAAIEGIQALIPERSPEWSDLGIDLFGVLLGLGLWLLGGERLRRWLHGLIAALGWRSRVLSAPAAMTESASASNRG